jgi:hypothetical protein
MTPYEQGYFVALEKLGFELADIPVPAALVAGGAFGGLTGYNLMDLLKKSKKAKIIASALGAGTFGPLHALNHARYREEQGR